MLVRLSSPLERAFGGNYDPARMAHAESLRAERSLEHISLLRERLQLPPVAVATPVTAPDAARPLAP
jgi:hypothetical protein